MCSGLLGLWETCGKATYHLLVKGNQQAFQTWVWFWNTSWHIIGSPCFLHTWDSLLLQDNKEPWRPENKTSWSTLSHRNIVPVRQLVSWARPLLPQKYFCGGVWFARLEFSSHPYGHMVVCHMPCANFFFFFTKVKLCFFFIYLVCN